MPNPRYLTKSRFKLACECPAKLYYTQKKGEYSDRKYDDPFLRALADGGYQVGELAKYYFPDGNDVETLDHETALNETNELLANTDVTIYEAAVRDGSLFVRVDVLNKKGNRIDLIEVKAKSYDPSDPDVFVNKRDGYLSSKWKPYLYDVAFQKYVLSQAFPNQHIHAYLLLVNKKASCPVDELNQNFIIVKDTSRRRSIEVVNDVDQATAQAVLSLVPVDQYCDMILANQDSKVPHPLSFPDRVKLFSDHYEKDEKINTPISSACKQCEFKAMPDEGLKSGFEECWLTQLGWSTDDVRKPTILDLWDNRSKDKHITAGKYRLSDLYEEDIKLKDDQRPGLSRTERQWLQIEKGRHGNKDEWIDEQGLSQEMSAWTFPLHFIDFETASPALPFLKGRRPYEGIAFQFSHHTVDADGNVEHVGQYLNTASGIFPNYDFVRALKDELDKDSGTIFRYAAHENTYLNMIHRQLQEDPAPISDRQELCDFIEMITEVKGGRAGPRNMVDMLYLVKRYYYDPECNGSNSIKQVLPSILNRSKFLQDKYSQPIYGGNTGIPSLNFEKWTWVKQEDGKIVDPYHLLPKLFVDISSHDMDILLEDDEIREGGAAMTAYIKMQFEHMSDIERAEIESALLKYCELDTLAMVMIYEGWRDLIT